MLVFHQFLDAATEIRSGLTLVAFLAVCAALALWLWTRHTRNVLRSLPELDRPKFLLAYAERYELPTSGLKGSQIERLVLASMANRDRRNRRSMFFLALVAVLLAAVAILSAITPAPATRETDRSGQPSPPPKKPFSIEGIWLGISKADFRRRFPDIRLTEVQTAPGYLRTAPGDLRFETFTRTLEIGRGRLAFFNIRGVFYGVPENKGLDALLLYDEARVSCDDWGKVDDVRIWLRDGFQNEHKHLTEHSTDDDRWEPGKTSFRYCAAFGAAQFDYVSPPGVAYCSLTIHFYRQLPLGDPPCFPTTLSYSHN